MELATWLAAWHGALTMGLTTYPALETRLTLTPPQIYLPPAVELELAVKAPVSKAEPLTLQAGVHVTLWRF